jgi:hypothetical protein
VLDDGVCDPPNITHRRKTTYGSETIRVGQFQAKARNIPRAQQVFNGAGYSRQRRPGKVVGAIEFCEMSTPYRFDRIIPQRASAMTLVQTHLGRFAAALCAEDCRCRRVSAGQGHSDQPRFPCSRSKVASIAFTFSAFVRPRQRTASRHSVQRSLKSWHLYELDARTQKTKERNMTDKTTPHPDWDARSENSDYPRATAAEKLTGGMGHNDMIGICPGDADDGFEEAIRDLRRSRRTRDPSSW